MFNKIKSIVANIWYCDKCGAANSDVVRNHCQMCGK